MQTQKFEVQTTEQFRLSESTLVDNQTQVFTKIIKTTLTRFQNIKICFLGKI